MKTYMKRRHTPTLGQKHQRSKGTHQETHDQTQRGRMHMLNPTKRAHAQTHRDIIKFHTLILCSLYEFHTFILYSLHKFHTLILRVCVCVFHQTADHFASLIKVPTFNSIASPTSSCLWSLRHPFLLLPRSGSPAKVGDDWSEDSP